MEWLFWLFILWIISAISGNSSKSIVDPSKDRLSPKTKSDHKNNTIITSPYKKTFGKETPSNKKNDNLTSTNKEAKPFEDIHTNGNKVKKNLRTNEIHLGTPRTFPFPSEFVNKQPKPDPNTFSRIKEPENSCQKIRAKLNHYGISSIWHMTHISNVKEILNSGILSNKNAYEKKNPVDISDHGVQRHRQQEEPLYGRKLHEYVPTYLNIKNPMLYVKRDIQYDLCLIEISLDTLSDGNFVFTDGNAASRATNFYNKVDDLEKIPWDVLNASYWNDLPDGKRKRCSEVLIYPEIEPKHIIKLHCFSTSAFMYLSTFDVPVGISESVFFG